MAESDATEQTPEVTPEVKESKFPTAFTILMGITVVVWLLTFIIPAGSYQFDEETGDPIAGSYEQIEMEITPKDAFMELFLAPVNGLYGIDSGGYIGPYESGDMFGAIQVFFFVLAIGAFITVTLKTGALDAGIARMAFNLKDQSMFLIIGLMTIFAIGGTTYGMAEETLGFYALVVPLMLSLGYDRMVGVGVIMLGAGIGTLASTVNPFATGTASAIAGVGIGDGITTRMIMWVVLTAITIGYVVWYAQRVKKDPTKSLALAQPEDAELRDGVTEEPAALTGQQTAALWVFGLTFALMIFSVIPWAQVLTGDSSADPYGWELYWYFPELAALFLLMAIVMGILGGLGEKGMWAAITEGMGDFMSAALIIAVARGVTAVMNNAHITDTILASLEGAVSGTSSGVFAVLMWIINIPIAFLVPSSSGHAALAMPIMSQLGEFANVSTATIITGYQSASGFVNLLTPTSAIVMGGLALAKVPYERYLRWLAPLLGVLFVVISIFLFIAGM